MKNLIIIFLLLFSLISTAQTKKEIETIISQYDLVKLEALKQRLKTEAEKDRIEVLQFAKQNRLKVKSKTKDGNYQIIRRIVDGKPVYFTTHNVDAAKATRVDHLNTGGSLGLNLMGQNMTAHVWDAGIARVTHQEYDGAGGNNRYSVGDGSTNLDFHSAHVAGTIMASGVDPNAKGMAPYSRVIGYDFFNDTSEAVNAATNGMLISNHSYGESSFGTFFKEEIGVYNFLAITWDEIMYNAPYYLMVVSAGNDGEVSHGSHLEGNSNYDKLLGFQTAKNNLVVANAEDAIISNGNLVSVAINSKSSQGPTDDYRIKPDITGNGTEVYSTYESSNTAYETISGTSMSSPNVAGTLLLLQQHYKNNNGHFMKAATLKGLALHTADDAGSVGPDAIFGWGLLNAKKAAESITKNGTQSKIEEQTLINGQTQTFTVYSDNSSPLKASISWTDRKGVVNGDYTTSGPLITGYNATGNPVLVNDLDIRVTKNGTSYKPWKLTGVTSNTKSDNSVDPFERVDVAGASGAYTITVSHKGSLTGGSQNYSLVLTGLDLTSCNNTVYVNQNVNSSIDLQQAAQKIIATNSITNNATAVYHAGSEVLLTAGFTALRGTKVRTYLEGCSNNYVSKSAQTITSTKNIDIEDQYSGNETLVFPNPSKGKFTINFKDSITGKIEIFDIRGVLAHKQDINNQSKAVITMQNYAKGFYFVKITSEFTTVSKKIIIE